MAKSYSIYIVEDEMLLTVAMKSQLIKAGYRVLGISTRGETCLNDLQKFANSDHLPDYVFMDISLKGEMDGLEAARLIREKYGCKIVFLSGLSGGKSFEIARQFGPEGFLTKPFEIEDAMKLMESSK